MARLVLSAAALLLLCAPPACWASEHRANPIRKVVTMLQNMEQQVREEGEKEKKAYEEFMCYCKTGANTLETSMEASKGKIEALESKITEQTEKKAATDAALKEHTASRAEAKDQMAKATALRNAQSTAFMKLKSDADTNVSALAAAVAAIEKGMGASFLQSSSANLIKTYAMEKANMPDADRQNLLAFLSGTVAYAPKSGEIVGILKEMGDEMAADLLAATKAEEEAKATYEAMMSAKTKEVNTLTAQIEEEMMRLGELSVLLAEDSNDLEETKDTLGEDTTYLAELRKGCATKDAEWEARCKVRSDELVALAETIKVLNDDDSLELFKKTLPGSSASLVQMQEGLAITRARVVAVLRNAPRRGTEIDLVLMALQGKTAGFEKVIKLIQDMVANLKKEQADDDSKKTYCESELDKSEDTGKQLERSIEVSGTAIEELKGAIATWTTEIGDLQASIRDLDSSVAEATKLRKEENSEFKDLMTNNKAAKEVLLWAKNRLNKFYNPKLYKPEALAQTAPQLVQVSAHRRGGGDAAPPPPPETFGAYVNKGQQTGGVVSMIDMLVGELDKEMSEAEVSEKDAQADYETLMSDAGAKRAADTKAVTDKAAAKAKGEESLQAETDNKKGLSIELMETKQVIANLHAECDWLTTYYDVRRQARTEEIESLGKAEAVLSGADYSLLQTRRAALRGA